MSQNPGPAYSIDALIAQTRRLAAEFRALTGRPLPVSAEIAQYDASRLLELDPVSAGTGGYDALGRGSRSGRRIQIKGRVIPDEGRGAHRIGQLKLDQDWDILMLVLMDEQFEPSHIYEAERPTIEACLNDTQCKRRNSRGAMSVAKFKNIARLVWSRERGREDGPPQRPF
ncbi:MAG: hypothetical protein WAN46_02965 [Gammaproteobacteria bacterium]|jgi:hypothetical protein